LINVNISAAQKFVIKVMSNMTVLEAIWKIRKWVEMIVERRETE